MTTTAPTVTSTVLEYTDEYDDQIRDERYSIENLDLTMLLNVDAALKGYRDRLLADIEEVLEYERQHLSYRQVAIRILVKKGYSHPAAVRRTQGYPRYGGGQFRAEEDIMWLAEQVSQVEKLRFAMAEECEDLR
jgi:hypothetical protein